LKEIKLIDQIWDLYKAGKIQEAHDAATAALVQADEQTQQGLHAILA